MKFFLEKISFKRAFLHIFLSILIFPGSGLIALLYYRNFKEKQRHDPAYQIVAIVQSSPYVEAFKTIYFAELLDLSVDNPKNLFAFDTKWGCGSLLKCPVIKEASIAKIRPGALLIEYTLRKPYAFLGDFSNTVIDKEKVPFPFKPCYSPKKLPEIYLGLAESAEWGIPMSDERLNLAFEIMDFWSEHSDIGSSATLKTLDVSKATAQSFGQREIVLSIEIQSQKIIEGLPKVVYHSHILRLMPSNYVQQLSNYLALKKYLEDNINLFSTHESQVNSKTTTFDLRLLNLAFMKEEKQK